MSSSSAEAGRATFEELEIAYEHAYGHNPLKIECIETLLRFSDASTTLNRTALDVGCGTGKPVAEMLVAAGFDVTGIDISPKMIRHASNRVRGRFLEADFLTYQPGATYSAVVIMFSLLQLSSWAEFVSVLHKYQAAVQPGGYLVIGTVPADNYVHNKEDYGETGIYAVNYPVPFMGKDELNLIVTAAGLHGYITALGFEVLSDRIDVFHPNDPRCVPEHQQYVIARRC